ncbi:MAG: type II toxin-antitoxin system RatA family toxin [Solirubrobacteraceae bacterium]
MPAYAGGSQAIVSASAQEIFALMLDFERLPEWQRAVKSATVLSRDREGRAHEVAYEIDVRVGVVRYTLRHSYEVPSRIGSVYVEGDFRDCDGEWTFDDLGDGTTQAGFRLQIDPGRIIPRSIVRMLNKRVMKGSVDDLQRYYAKRA